MQVSWDTVKDIQARSLHKRFGKPKLHKLKHIAIEEIAIGKGHHYLTVVLNGEAAIAGQGSVAETLNLSQLAGYKTGGTIHVVLNNQIGFTTGPADARSSCYCTDVAKMIDVPILHVNAEDPEATAFAAELALEFRQTFHKDMVIDMYCYRKWGHNEGDEPSFTQPLMYEKILERPPLSEVYTDQLLTRGDLSLEESQAIVQEFQKKLDEAQAETKAVPRYAGMPGMHGYQGRWKSFCPSYSPEPVPTGVPMEILDGITANLTRIPEGFNAHPQVARMLETHWRAWRGQTGRLELRRGAGVWLAAPGGRAGSAERPRLPARHLQPAPRRSLRPKDRPTILPAGQPRSQAGQVLRLR